MVSTDLTQKQIAEELNVSVQTIINWKKKDEFIEFKDDYQRKYLNNLAAKAIRTMDKLLTSDSDQVRYNAAKDILDRTGYKPTEKQNINMSGSLANPYEALTTEQLLKLAGDDDG